MAPVACEYHRKTKGQRRVKTYAQTQHACTSALPERLQGRLEEPKHQDPLYPSQHEGFQHLYQEGTKDLLHIFKSS